MATQSDERTRTSVAKVIEISCESSESFDDAIQRGIAKAADSVHGIRSAWIANQQVTVENEEVVAYRVDLKVTFVLD
jgi:dodecin